MLRYEKSISKSESAPIRIATIAALMAASLAATALQGMPPDQEPSHNASNAGQDGDAEIREAISRLRELGAFVREFHQRDNPKYWVQIISTGVGEMAGENAENLDDEALGDVEIVTRGVVAHVHLRNTSMSSAGLERLKSAGNISLLELTGPNVDDAMLQVLPKLPLHGCLALDSDELTNNGLQSLSECRHLTSISLKGRSLSNDCLKHLIGLPKLEGIALGNGFSAAAYKILAPLKDLKELDVATVATPQLGDLKMFPNLRRLSLSGRIQDDETAQSIADSFEFLEQAYLRDTAITNTGVEHISRLKMLKTLTLDRAPIDDEVAGSIQGMKQLEWLSLDGCAVGDATLAAACECPDLWNLSLTNTLVTDDRLAELVKLRKLQVLNLTSCRSVTDASIESLVELPDSDGLLINIQNSGITEQGARRLQKALPLAQIRWGVPAVPLR